MKVTHQVLLLVFVIFFASCGKEESMSSAAKEEDMFRDWAKKGKRTPAPHPGQVLNRAVEPRK